MSWNLPAISGVNDIMPAFKCEVCILDLRWWVLQMKSQYFYFNFNNVIVILNCYQIENNEEIHFFMSTDNFQYVLITVLKKISLAYLEPSHALEMGLFHKYSERHKSIISLNIFANNYI